MMDFTFTWKIEQFFLSVNKNGGYVSSPTFIVDSIGKTAWFLDIYPHGDGDEIHVACYLNRCDIEGGGESNISLDFSFSLVMADGTEQLLKIFENQVFPVGHRYGCKDLIRCEDIWEDIDDLLPMEILTVRCNMKSRNAAISASQSQGLRSLANYIYGGKRFMENLPAEMYTAANEVFCNARKKLCPYPDQCTARTKVRTEEWRLIWKIKNFTGLLTGEKVTLPVIAASSSTPSLLLTCYLDDDTYGEHIQVEIRLMENTTTTNIVSDGEITVLNDKKRRCAFNIDRYFFEADKKDQVWKFPLIIRKDKLLAHKTTHLKNDTLSLLCEFILSDSATVSQIDYSAIGLDEKDENIVSLLQMKDDFIGLTNEAKLCDVSVLIGKEKIPAHKAVLSAMSPVFKAMFDRNMAEKESETVNVADLDVDTLKRMMAYMYDGKVKDLECESAEKLYSAADKYQCLGLKDYCANFLKKNLSLENVWDVLILADMHQDKELEASTDNFISRKLPQILRSEEWRFLMENKTQLARKTLHRIVCGSE